MSDQELTKLTVNLIPEAQQAFQELQDITGFSGTDVANRALQIYLFVENTLRGGQEFWALDPETGRGRQVTFK